MEGTLSRRVNFTKYCRRRSGRRGGGASRHLFWPTADSGTVAERWPTRRKRWWGRVAHWNESSSGITIVHVRFLAFAQVPAVPSERTRPVRRLRPSLCVLLQPVARAFAIIYATDALGEMDKNLFFSPIWRQLQFLSPCMRFLTVPNIPSKKVYGQCLILTFYKREYWNLPLIPHCSEPRIIWRQGNIIRVEYLISRIELTRRVNQPKK